MSAVGTVISVYRGGCELVYQDAVHAVRLVGKHAHQDQALAVGDEVSFDPEREIVIDVLPRRTKLARRRPRAPHKEQVIAANIDRLAIVAAATRPPFRAGAVDRFLLTAYAGGLDAILVVTKIDLLDEPTLPDEARAYEGIVPVVAVSAKTGEGVDELAPLLRGRRTVFAGHSGVGKSSLLNALEPELRLETGEISAKHGRGRHTTTHASWIRIRGDAIVVDTPGLREIATGPVDLELLDRVYPDVAELAEDCRFRDCMHAAEPDCAVREAIEKGSLPEPRLRGYQKLLAEASG